MLPYATPQKSKLQILLMKYPEKAEKRCEKKLLILSNLNSREKCEQVIKADHRTIKFSTCLMIGYDVQQRPETLYNFAVMQDNQGKNEAKANIQQPQ